MGQTTANLGIWTPDAADLAEADVWSATMSASIENGVGERILKLENFIGCNLSISSAFTATTTLTQVPFAVVGAVNFNEGMTVSGGGAVTVPFDGIYHVDFMASFLGATTTPGRINTYVYVDGVPVQFNSTYGEVSTIRYCNANISNNYKLSAGDVIDVRVSSFDANSVLQANNGSGFSVALLSRDT